MDKKYLPFKNRSDHDFIHQFTRRMNKIKTDLYELHELVEQHVMKNLTQPRSDEVDNDHHNN